MSEDRLGCFAVARLAVALLQGIVVDREPGRVDPQLNENSYSDVFLQYWVGNLKTAGVSAFIATPLTNS